MNNRAEALGGVLPVIQTPYRSDWTIDEAVLEREVDWLFAEGVDGLVIAMVSEVIRLTDAERDQLTETVVRLAAGRGPVIASVGAESTRQAVRHTKAAEDAGADGLMAVPPSLSRCNAGELSVYYEAILEASPLPLVVQDASGYVGNAIPVATQAALLNLAPERMFFKPEAQPIGPNVSALLKATGGRARIFEGTAGLALMDSHPRGIVGTMPGADVPWAIVAIWRALQEGDFRRAAEIHAQLAALVNLMHNLDAYLAIEKLLLVEQGIFTSTRVRGPVGYHADAGTESEVLRLLKALEEICGR